MKVLVENEPVTDAEAALALRTRELRTARGWSQEDLAAKMRDRGYQWHQTTAAKTEAGGRPVRVNEAQVLAEVLGVPLAALVTVDDGTEEHRLRGQLLEVMARASELMRAKTEAGQEIEAATARLKAAEKELKTVTAEVDRINAKLKALGDRG